MYENLDAAKMVAITAKLNAHDVDRDGRFPIEAVTELKRLRLLSIANDFQDNKELLLPQILSISYLLATACPSTAMIFAMHTLCVIQLSSHGSGWHKRFLSDLEKNQYLIASSTSEATIGGATAESDCAKADGKGKFYIRKNASVVSYGLEADAILVTARRDEDAARNQQILAICLKRDCSVELHKHWDSLGMRGTCSHALDLTLTGVDEQVFEEPFSKILDITGLPTAHLVWGHVWLGIATDAYNKARSYLRHKRRQPGALEQSEQKLFRCFSRVIVLKGVLSSAKDQYLNADHCNDTAIDRSIVMAMNALKVRVSEEAIQIVQEAMDICGLQGYLNRGEFTIAQNYRDVLSSKYMVSNRRIEENMFSACLITPLD